MDTLIDKGTSTRCHNAIEVDERILGLVPCTIVGREMEDYEVNLMFTVGSLVSR